MMGLSNRVTAGIATLGALLAGGSAWAQDALQGLETVGKPVDGKMGFQPAVTEMSRDLQWLDQMLGRLYPELELYRPASPELCSANHGLPSRPPRWPLAYGS